MLLCPRYLFLFRVRKYRFLLRELILFCSPFPHRVLETRCTQLCTWTSLKTVDFVLSVIRARFRFRLGSTPYCRIVRDAYNCAFPVGVFKNRPERKKKSGIYIFFCTSITCTIYTSTHGETLVRGNNTVCNVHLCISFCCSCVRVLGIGKYMMQSCCRLSPLPVLSGTSEYITLFFM